MSPTQLEIARRDIVQLLDEQPRRVFTRGDLDRIVSENREFWRLATSTTTLKFIEFLRQKAQLVEHRLEFPNRTQIRYSWGQLSPLEVAEALHPESYLTHYTALYLHELSEQVPRMIYVNVEQPRKIKRQGQLAQEAIDRAFKRKPRVSSNIATYGDQRICLLNGMFTGGLGVATIESETGVKLRYTNIERTLIDIAVRPFYAGGVFEVMKAYRIARPKVSVNRLVAYLKRLNYVYPYHQAIGFYMEKSGVYEPERLALIHETFPMEFDFYLAYGVKDADYSETWRIFFPRGL